MPGRRHLALLLAASALCCVFAAQAQATSYQRPLIGTFGSVEEPMFRRAPSIAVAPTTGDVLVGDEGGSEQQKLTVDATAGTFRLSFEGDTTEDIPFDVDDKTLSEILAGAFGPGIEVAGETREGPPGETVGKSPFQIGFRGTYANSDVEQISCEDGSVPLSGGSGCSATTLADGKALGLYRYRPDGTPDPFSALGSNRIDGMAGPGGLPCNEEPASCDKTPQNEIDFGVSGADFGAQVSVDPTTGNIYLSQNGGQVDIFSPEGKYLGQLTAAGTKKFSQPCGVVIDSSGAVYVAQSGGISKFVPSADLPVNADNVANFAVVGYEYLCHMALGVGPSAGWIFITNNHGVPAAWALKVNAETGEFSEFAEGHNGRLTVDPTNGNPIVESAASGSGLGELAEFDGSLDSTSSVLSKLVVEAPELARVSAVATDASGSLYVAYGRFGNSATSILVYGHPEIVPTVTIDPAEEVTADAATLSGTVEADGIEVEDCFFEWGKTSSGGAPSWDHTTPCEETVPTDSEAHEVHAKISGLEPNRVKYNFRLAAKNENGTERSATASLVSARTVQTKPATVSGTETATLHGSLRPEGSGYTECVFEWGLTTSFGFEHSEPCEPEAGEIPADTSIHSVDLPLSGLQEATEYRFRLKATNGEGTIEGSTLTFETFGAPQITSIGARDATRSAVSLEAKIDPSGFATTYHFEWGTTPGYGHVLPLKTLDAGEKPIRVATVLSGLAGSTVYHYRLIAESDAGTTDSGDQVAETLNSCGLPEERCFELVSRRDTGPVAIPGLPAEPIEKHYQAATSGPGGLAYPVESGYPDANTGYSVLYRGLRDADGWSSNPVRPSVSGEVQWLSDDLSCGFLQSAEALTDDPGPSLGTNLYRSNPDGTFTAAPRIAPEGSTGGGFATAGASQDCHEVAFSTTRRYHGVAVAAGSGKRLYEWDEGTLRGVGIVPGPSGDVVVDARAAAFNAVSADGSRVFFTATRQTSPNAGEVGKQGIFVREDGTTTRDLSLSETSIPDNGASFQYATADGSKVFFLANYGLTADSSAGETTNNCSGGGLNNNGLCDLYEYDLEEDELTDLSVDHEAGGAEVGGVVDTSGAVGAFVGASEDGSHVYFLARGQFLPAYGKTKAENKSEGTYSLYGVADGEVSFVGTVGGGAEELRQLARPGERKWVSNVSPDGRYLLFQTATDVTDYKSGGVREAYLYDSDKGSGGTICLSCRPDGKPSAAPPLVTYNVLATGGANNPPHQTQFLTVGSDGPRAFFSSLDALAPGAVEGQNNVYEWSHGQLFRLAGTRAGRNATADAAAFAAFVGADASGSDAYLVTPESLNWEDPDERLSVYDARIGGGFPEPAPAPKPCDPNAEGSCQGAATPAPGAAPGAASAGYSGPGNVKPKQAKKQKKRHRRHRKKRGRKARGKHAKHKKSRHGKAKSKHRRANTNRRAGK